MADGKVRIIIDTNAKETTADMKKLEKSLQDVKGTSDSGAASTNKLDGAMSALKGSVGKLVGAYAGFNILKSVWNYSNQAVEAFRQQDIAIKQLNQTLVNTGSYSAQYSQHLQQLASEIQSFSNYGDEATIKAVALGQAFSGNVRLTDDLIKATIDFAAATGKDLDSAFTLVGKSIGSQTNALGRYGISLDKNMSESQKMEAITKQLGAAFEGTAKETANSSVQMRNALGDLAEAIGNILNPAFETSEKFIIKWANNATNAINFVKAHLVSMQKATLNDLFVKYSDLDAKIARLQEKAAKTRDSREKKYTEWRIEEAKKQQEEIYKRQKQLAASEQQKEAISKTKSFKINDDYGLSSVGGGGGGKSATAKVKEVQNAYQQLQKQVNDARTAVQVAAVTYGTSSEQVVQAFTKYKALNEQLSSVDNIFDENKTSAQLLQDKITELTSQLQELYLSGQGDTDLFKQTKNSLFELQTQLRDMNTAIISKFGIDWSNTARSIKSDLSNALTTPLAEGESAFQRLGNVALNIIQAIGQKAVEQLIDFTLASKAVKTATSAIGGLFGGFGGFLGGLFASKNGNVFKNGNIVPFANGGVVNSPTLFPMNNGIGLMGEAGSEAIMPLKRGKNGNLGVQASTPNINIYNQSQSQIETVKRPNGDMDIFIKRVNEAISNERTSAGFRNAFNRQSNYGVQAV